MMCRKFSLVAGLLFSAASAFSQITTIQGDVKGADGQPANGAQILIEREDMGGTYKGHKTNKKGHYIYIGLPIGTYTVSIIVDGKIVDSVGHMHTRVDAPAIVDFDLAADTMERRAQQAATNNVPETHQAGEDMMHRRAAPSIQRPTDRTNTMYDLTGETLQSSRNEIEKPGYTAAANAGRPEMLTNLTVMELVKVGLPSDVIIKKINDSACRFQRDANGLIALKQATVPDEVIRAMLVKRCDEPDTNSSAPRDTSQIQDRQRWRDQLAAKTVTLGVIRRIFLDQTVVIGGPLGTRGAMLTWNLARQAGKRFKADMFGNLPATYRGKTGKVVAVQLNESMRSTQGANALGESISDDERLHPYFDLVVQFDDGTLAMTTDYPLSLALGGQEVELASVQSNLSGQMSKDLPLVIGKVLYAVGFSHLYRPDTTLDELSGEPGAHGVLKEMFDLPLLQPLRIVEAKYIDAVNGVVLKVRLPDGRDALSFTNSIYLLGVPGVPDTRTFFEKVAGRLEGGIPSGLTPKEIEAIKSRSIFRGMSKDALHYALGYPKKENDWGAGGKQLIYGGSLSAYLDLNEKVEDWHDLGRE